MKYITVNLLIICLLFFSCGKKEAENTSEAASIEVHQAPAKIKVVSLTEVQFKNMDLQTTKVLTKNLNSILKVTGKIDVPPQNMVSITPPAAGFLRKTDLLPGSKVKKGQLVAVIQNPDFIAMQQDLLQSQQEIAQNDQEVLQIQQEINDLQSQLEYLEAEYHRQQELAKENINAGKSLQLAKSQVNSMKAKMQGLQAKSQGVQAKSQGMRAKIGGLKAHLQLIGINTDKLSPDNFQTEIAIYAPISGYVTKVNTNIGKFINATDVLFDILDNTHVHAELYVFEKDIPKLKIGQKVRVVLSSETKERLATIHLIGKEITENKTVQVHCHLDDEDKELTPGTYLKALVEIGNAAVTALPENAIVQDENTNFIFVASNKINTYSYEMVEVQTGIAENGFVEVQLPVGFDENALIVEKGAYQLLSVAKKGEEAE